MPMVKVIYVDQSAGRIKDSRLHDLIALGKVAAYCGPSGWISVTGEDVSHIAEEFEHSKEGESENENAGN